MPSSGVPNLEKPPTDEMHGDTTTTTTNNNSHAPTTSTSPPPHHENTTNHQHNHTNAAHHTVPPQASTPTPPLTPSTSLSNTPSSALPLIASSKPTPKLFVKNLKRLQIETSTSSPSSRSNTPNHHHSDSSDDDDDESEDSVEKKENKGDQSPQSPKTPFSPAALATLKKVKSILSNNNNNNNNNNHENKATTGTPTSPINFTTTVIVKSEMSEDQKITVEGEEEPEGTIAMNEDGQNDFELKTPTTTDVSFHAHLPNETAGDNGEIPSPTSPPTFDRSALKLDIPKHRRSSSFQRSGSFTNRLSTRLSVVATPRAIKEALPGFGIEDVEEDLPIMQSMKKFFFPEIWFLFKSCYAIIITNICLSSQESIEFAFAGQLGETELAAAALAQAYFNCCVYILIGLVSGQTTLVAQAEGLKNFAHVRRTVLKRSFLLITLFSIPLLVLLNIGGYVLLMLREEAIVIDYTATYLHYYSISLLAQAYNTILADYMVAQSFFVLPMLVSVLGVVIDVLANLTLTRGLHRKKTKIGFIGAPISAAITRWSSFIMLCLCVLFVEWYKTRAEKKEKLKEKEEAEKKAQEEEVMADQSFNLSFLSVQTDDGSHTTIATEKEKVEKAKKEEPKPAEEEEEEENLTFIRKVGRFFERNVIDVIHPRGVWEYMKVGIPGTVMLAAETWNLEIVTIIAGFLQNPLYLSAHSVVVSVIVWVYTVPFSVSVATSVRVGYCIGKNKPNKAKVAAFIGVGVSLIFMTLALVVSASLRWYLPRIFTSSRAVLEITAILLPIASAIQILDGFQCCVASVIQGMGNQYVGAVANILGYYCIGFPVGVMLAFATPIHIYGLWVGIGVGLLFVTFVVSGYVVVFSGFRREVSRAKRRVKRSDTRMTVTNRKKRSNAVIHNPKEPVLPVSTKQIEEPELKEESDK